MRLISYRYQGKSKFGVIANAAVRDLSAPGVETLRAALETWDREELNRRVAAAGAPVPLTEIRYLQPITNPDKILCVGLNYHLHAKEAGLPIPEHPSIFVRFPSSQVGHGEPIVRPRASEQLDYEAELALVIGRRARHVQPEDAFGYVAGYSCFAENSVRDWQTHTRQATPGKNFHQSGAFGPWLVTADEIPHPERLEVIGRLNGEVLQRDVVHNMIFPLAKLIAYASTFTELLPGDVLVTGTPAGVGFTKKPPLYLRPGDVFEVEVTGVGILRNPVVEETN